MPKWGLCYNRKWSLCGLIKLANSLTLALKSALTAFVVIAKAQITSHSLEKEEQKVYTSQGQHVFNSEELSAATTADSASYLRIM